MKMYINHSLWTLVKGKRHNITSVLVLSIILLGSAYLNNFTRLVWRKCKIQAIFVCEFNSYLIRFIFQNLKEARLTHSFHCCAFKFPEQHDPKRHAQFEETMRKTCEQFEKLQTGGKLRRRRRRSVQMLSSFETYAR